MTRDKKESMMLFLFCFTLVVVATCIIKRDVFNVIYYAKGDYAANSMLILKAKSFQLLTGNYSRTNCYHPGPFYMYWMALFETVFYDLLKIVPGSFNAHMLSGYVLNALCIAYAVLMIKNITKCSLNRALFAFLLMLVFISFHPQFLFGTWMPHLYFFPFLLFVFTSIQMLNKQYNYLPAYILFSCILVHGQVTFAVQIIPMFCFLLGSVLHEYKKDIKRFFFEYKKPVYAASVILALFLMPIIVHTIKDFPGEFYRYLRLSGKGVLIDTQAKGFADIVRYYFLYWSDKYSPEFYFSLILILICGFKALNCCKDDKDKAYLKNTFIIFLLTSVLFFVEIWLVFDILFEYLGYFFGAVPLALTLILMVDTEVNLDTSRYKSLLTASIVLSIVIVLCNANSRNYTTSTYGNTPQRAAVIMDMASDSKVAMRFEHNAWGDTVGIVNYLVRNNYTNVIGASESPNDSAACLIFTKEYYLNKDDPGLNDYRIVDVVLNTGEPIQNVNVIYQDDKILIFE